jgi:signal transduction histidine kinase
VFFRFYQVDRGGRKDFPGAGLGLSLARELALAHGGWLQVREREGWSSTFSFGIPVDSEQTVSALQMQRSTIHLPTIINGIIHMLEQEQGHDLGITFPLPSYGAPDHCIGDRAFLRAILINIIQNCIKYRSKGTTIKIRLQPWENEMQILIENQGKTFAADELSRIFNDQGPAQGGRPDHGPRFMSLQSARKILLALDGSFEIENITDTGNTAGTGAVRFTIGLPQPQSVRKGEIDVQEKDSRY